MNELLGKYLNGYKIVSIEKDPFIKGQINLWTDVCESNYFGDRNLIKFFVRDEENSNKIYRELIDKEIYKLKMENQLLKKVFDDVLEWGQYQDRYTWKQLEGILSKLNELEGKNE